MSDAGGHGPAQQIARALSQSVASALEAGASTRTLERARELAELLSLRGLGSLLGVLAPHAGGVWPVPLRPVVERVQRAAAECTREDNVDVFRRVDHELALMARAIERVPLGRLASPAPDAPARPAWSAAESAVVPLAEVLDGVPAQHGNPELLHRVRLHSPVAGALRAALDWLVGGSAARTRMWLASDGSALDVTCEGIAYTGVQPAAEVLESVGAHLGPAGERPGSWTVRVPILAERETFLMIEQDELQLAVPWHAVVRVRLIPAATIETMVHRQGLPVLPPLAVAARRSAEQPVVVVALGLKRACLVADRLVWRMSAEPVQAPGRPPAEGIVRSVRSDDDQVYWVLEPGWLLRGVAAPPMAQPGRRGSGSETASPATSPRPGSPAPRPPIPFSAPPVPTPLAAPGPEHVEPPQKPPAAAEAGATATVPEPAPTATAPSPVAPPPSPAMPPAPATPRAPASRRALVAEDSITARIFLVRLLEQQGFLVHAVATAAELREWLPRGPWSLVCADCVLPDVRGAEFLRDLTQSVGAARVPLVALVRDAEDEKAARAAGVAATLRKPFEREALERMLSRLAHDVSGGSGRGHGVAPDPREWGAR